MLAGGSAFAAGSPAIHSGLLFGNIPNVTVRGVQAGKAPWIVQGHYKLTATNLVAGGKWLIIPKVGYMSTGQAIPKAIADTTLGVTAVGAEITFANAPSIVLPPVKLSTKGYFSINARYRLPKGANQPVVLIGPVKNGKMVAWFASSNFLMDYGAYNKAMVGGAMGASAGGSSSSSGGGKSSSSW